MFDPQSNISPHPKSITDRNLFRISKLGHKHVDNLPNGPIIFGLEGNFKRMMNVLTIHLIVSQSYNLHCSLFVDGDKKEKASADDSGSANDIGKNKLIENWNYSKDFDLTTFWKYISRKSKTDVDIICNLSTKGLLLYDHVKFSMATSLLLTDSSLKYGNNHIKSNHRQQSTQIINNSLNLPQAKQLSMDHIQSVNQMIHQSKPHENIIRHDQSVNQVQQKFTQIRPKTTQHTPETQNIIQMVSQSLNHAIARIEQYKSSNINGMWALTSTILISRKDLVNEHFSYPCQTILNSYYENLEIEFSEF